MASAVRFLPAIFARCHSALGWLSFRLGLRDRSRRHYEHVLRLRGDDFSAYVHLGRLAYDAGDYAGWRREFEHARRADPERFARLRHPFELFEPRLAGTSFDDAGERATWRSMRPFGAASPRRGARHEAGVEFTTPTESGVDALPAFGGDMPGHERDLQDDCSSDYERERLRELGPIRRTEWKTCDLEDLAQRLTGA